MTRDLEGGTPHVLDALIAGGRSNPTYEITDGTRSGVLRRPPHGHVVPTAHDMRREHRVLHALQGTAVPVPRVLGLCQDEGVIGAAPYVMNKLAVSSTSSPRPCTALPSTTS